MIAFLFAGLLTAAPVSDTALVPPAFDEATSTRGVAGVCVRWDRTRRAKVAEAVVVRSTGNARLDRQMQDMIPQWDWPTGVDDYRGQWVGIWLAVGGATAPAESEPLPDCSALRDRSWARAPAAAN